MTDATITYTNHLRNLISLRPFVRQAQSMNPKHDKSTKYGTLLPQDRGSDHHKVHFYCTSSGREPVREWLKKINPDDRKRIGEDLYTLQLGWPMGMPLARKLESDLWELRSRIANGIVRILFTEEKKVLILLHAFTKKSQKLPERELALARKRLASVRIGRKP